MKNMGYVIQRTASELGIPEEKVKIVLMEYWRTATSRLINLDATTVSIRHVGNMTVSRYKLYNYIRKRIEKIRFVKDYDKYDEEKRKELLEYNLSKLRKALVQRDILARYYQKRFKKK